MRSLKCLFMKRGIHISLMLFSPKQSNFPDHRIGYNTFISQVLRFSKICNDFDSLKIRLINLYNINMSIN